MRLISHKLLNIFFTSIAYRVYMTKKVQAWGKEKIVLSPGNPSEDISIYLFFRLNAYSFTS